MSKCDKRNAIMTLISYTSQLLNLHDELKFEDEFKKSNLLSNSANVECICVRMYVVDKMRCEGPPLEIIIDVNEKKTHRNDQLQDKISADVCKNSFISLL